MERGQSTIEFLLVFAFSFGILAVFIQLAVNLTGGYLVHYATFMASRTYLVQEKGSQVSLDAYTYATDKARKVFESYQVKSFGISDSNAELGFTRPGGQTDPFFTGVYYRYQQPLSLLSFLGGGVKAEMYSESFLGKEPSRGECWERTKAAIGVVNLSKFVTVFDNGC